jgi:integrase
VTGRKTRARANGEGSIFPYRNGFAAYVVVDTPAGGRRRKYVYGQTRDDVHRRWVALSHEAARGAVATSVPTVAQLMLRWLAEDVRPSLSPKTVEKYEMFSRLYVVPGLGDRRVDRLSVRDVQAWVNSLRVSCQCCAQGKDAARSEPRCCAVGACCGQVVSPRTIKDARDVLRAALGSAARDELVSRNVATLVRLPAARRRAPGAWTVTEARTFLESARSDDDPYYVAYVLLLVLGLRRGEVLGLGWHDVDLDAGHLRVEWQVQRVGSDLIRRETKTPTSDATLPLPGIAAAALRQSKELRRAWQAAAGPAWDDQGIAGGLVVTTRFGGALEPRNFYRSFQSRCRAAGVRSVPVHSTRRTCASLLAALDVHPRVAMQILRHSQIAVTMNVYTETYSEDTVRALQRLGETFDGPAGAA